MGRGGSSKVFRVLSTDAHVLALKRIKIRGSDRESMAGYANEITLLRRLRGKPGIITMHAADVDEQGGVIQMIMEAGDADLATVLQQRQSLSADGSRAAPERSHVNFVRLTWQQMLEAVDTIHEERIVHGDLKPANFLFVQGRLRLIDFGIARAIKNDTTNIYRDTQIGTLNYMSPEAIRDSNGPGRSVGSQRKPTMRLGRASDVWSLGCILYQMIYGRTPFGHLQLIQKLQAIIDPGHSIDMPLDAPLASTAALECLRGCMQREPVRAWSAARA
ncbi:kinase-like domain-containing protein [Pelagophyceae sp. CCMP2097]|nr:kinase-like domain-containing protein [Pelagophyceae sp. CCMP2097]